MLRGGKEPGQLRLRWITSAAAASLGLCVLTMLGPVSAAASPSASGPVDVLSAGSLQDLLQQQVGPAFQQATGYTLNDTSMGSDAIASGIKGGTLQGDVFISASPAVNKTLEGSANGNWVSWYASFGSSPLVLGYNPIEQIRRRPQDQAVVRRHRPARISDRSHRPRDRPEGCLGRHGSRPGGQDAPHPRPQGHRDVDVERLPRDVARRAAPGRSARCRVLLRVEAAAADIKTVPLTGTELAGVYTLTVLNRAPHEAAARAFVAFLLGKAGQRILEKNGIVAIAPPEVSGKSTVPKDLKELLSR